MLCRCWILRVWGLHWIACRIRRGWRGWYFRRQAIVESAWCRGGGRCVGLDFGICGGGVAAWAGVIGAWAVANDSSGRWRDHGWWLFWEDEAAAHDGNGSCLRREAICYWLLNVFEFYEQVDCVLLIRYEGFEVIDSFWWLSACLSFAFDLLLWQSIPGTMADAHWFYWFVRSLGSTHTIEREGRGSHRSIAQMKMWDGNLEKQRVVKKDK